MKQNTLIIIVVTGLVFFLASFLISVTYISKEYPMELKDVKVDCFDRKYNKIEGLVCYDTQWVKETEVPIYWSLFSWLSLTGIGLFSFVLIEVLNRK